LSLTPRGREAMQGQIHDLQICRPAADLVRTSVRRHRDARRHDWNSAVVRRRQAWPRSADAPYDFLVDTSKKFDRGDD
jgi:hypothetical protein